MGRIRMGYDDFCNCTPEEMVAICRESRMVEREEWERMRLLAAISVQPYAKDKLDPKKLLSFPWDSEAGGEPEKPKASKLTKEERYQRFLELQERLDGIQQHDIHKLQD